MKKLIKGALIVLILSTFIFTLLSCKGDGHAHTLAHREAVASTCTSKGNIEYWYCTECGECFTDGEGKNRVNNRSSLETERLSHVPSGEWGITGILHYRVCALCGLPCDDPSTHTADDNGICVCGKYMMSEGFAFVENDLGGLTLVSYTLSRTAALLTKS